MHGRPVGEYLKRRPEVEPLLQVGAGAAQIENDNAVPNAETVVKLSTALDGDLERMLEMAACLPREILQRLIDRAGEDLDRNNPGVAGFCTPHRTYARLARCLSRFVARPVQVYRNPPDPNNPR